MKINIVCGGLAALGFLVVLGLVGGDDYRHEVIEQVHYCDMVEQGHWPDYDQTAQYCGQARAVYAELNLDTGGA